MKKLMIVLLCILSVCFVSCSKNQNNSVVTEFKAETARQEYYYAMGNNFAKAYTENYEDMDLDAFMAGIQYYKEGNVVSDAEIEDIIKRYSAEMLEQIAVNNLAAAEAFLAENKKQDGVITTNSGLQYKVLVQGSGNTPSKNAKVNVIYTLTDLKGNVIGTSGENAVSFDLDNVVAGFAEAVMKMNTGSKITAWIHPDFGYGKQGSPVVEPQSLLIFDIELVSFTEE